jgi:hypothetical protein
MRKGEYTKKIEWIFLITGDFSIPLTFEETCFFKGEGYGNG